MAIRTLRHRPRRADRPPVQGGFTLLELLVAVAIFALVSAMAYTGLQTVLEARSRIQAEGQRLGGLQLAFGVIGRDLRQYLQRRWYDEWGDEQPAISYDPLDVEPRLELINTSGRVGRQRSEIRRIGYALEDGVLYRLNWNILDGGTRQPQSRSRLAGASQPDSRAHIEDIFYTFYHQPGGAHTSGNPRNPAPGRDNSIGDGIEELGRWPPDSTSGPRGRLLAIEVTLELGTGEQVNRLYPIHATAQPSEADTGGD